MNADWSIAVGFLVFLVAIVASTLFYLRYKKVYLVAYTASIATYVFSVFYIWDVYELNRNGVLVLLVISTLIMMYLGKYFSNINIKPSKAHTSLKEK